MKTGSYSKSYLPTRLLLILMAAVLCISLSAGELLAQDNRVTTANYTLAARFTSAKLRKMVRSTSVNPSWLEHSDRFWYTWDTPDSRMFYIVDPARKTKVPLFDNFRMAAELTRQTGDPYDHQHLPFRSFEFINEDRAIRFSVKTTKPAELDTAKAAEVDTTKREEEDKEEEEKVEEDRGRGARRGVTRPKEETIWFEYNLATGQLTLLEDYEEPERPPSWASIAPDSSVVIFARDHNLYMMDWENYLKAVEEEKEKEEEKGERTERGRVEEEAEEEKQEEKQEEEEKESEVVDIQLTTDGEEHYSFGSAVTRGMTDKEKEEAKGKRARARVIWSPDSKKFVVTRSDQRKVNNLWVINSLANPRPTLETYKYDMPGEENVTQYEIFVFDVASRERVQMKIDEFKDQSNSVYTRRQRSRPSDRGPRPSIWLSPDPNEVYITRTSRDMHRVDVCVADATTGDVRVVIEERLNTYIETQRLELLEDSNELIWWSERDGWGHYYLYGTDGTLKKQITAGPFSCRGISEIDEDNRVIFFTATGREGGEDPYYTHFYRVNLNGSRLQLLNPGNFSHSARIDEDKKYFVDNFSRVDTVPKSVLYDTRGQLLLELEEADLSRLVEAGYQFPEPFRVKADDDITDLYGVMYKPFDFDETKQYPIIAYVYPGPQTESVAKSFSTNSTTTSLAQFGFIVITVGNRGGHPHRSKWYHNYSYGDLRDYGLVDKKMAIEQLALRHPFIDIDRVGIFGHSGGGFMSTAAMLVYPDFFKVAVSSSGNHENNIYNKRWSEKHHGVTEVINEKGEVAFEYDIEKNSELAENLKGRLLIVHGDIDNNVHPANTLRLARALIRANKRFDLFIFPGARHGFGNMNDYFFWMRADYFCQHLLGEYADSVDMIELSREQDQSGGTSGRGGGGGVRNR